MDRVDLSAYGRLPSLRRWGGEMRKHLAVVVILAVSLGVAAQTKDAKSSKTGAKAGAAKAMPHNAFTPDEVKYGPAPKSVPAGAELAVLEGNPMGTSGDYTVRLKMPAGYQIAPHWHPKRENVTVLSGVLKVGMGDKFDESKMKSFPAGSFAYVDPSMHHYAKADGATEIQIHGMAPFKINYVNPQDDPSMKK